MAGSLADNPATLDPKMTLHFPSLHTRDYATP
jgi:hypothetical protein